MDKTDRSRLKEVHQTDLTESRVNQEFVDWLKSKGPTWLLVALVALCAYLGFHRYRTWREDKQAEAWSALFDAKLPASLEDVATQHGSVAEIDNVAWLGAADALLASIQTGTELGAVGADPTQPAPTTPLTEADRTSHLERAARNYQRVIDDDDGSDRFALFAVSAMNGMAAIAECRHDAQGAKEWYLKAAARAESFYPGLAALSRDRAEKTAIAASEVAFPAQADLEKIQGPLAPRDAVELDEALRRLVLPPDEAG